MSDHFPAARRTIPGAVDIPDAEILHGRERACDADRDRCIAHLAECFRLGYISEPVFHVRMAAVAEAVARDEFAKLLEDLPALQSPRRRLREIRASLGRETGRRWVHIIAATAALTWAILGAATVFAATGYPVIYGSGRNAWEATQHSSLALAGMWCFVITGVAGLAADIYWWVRFEGAS